MRTIDGRYLDLDAYLTRGPDEDEPAEPTGEDLCICTQFDGRADPECTGCDGTGIPRPGNSIREVNAADERAAAFCELGEEERDLRAGRQQEALSAFLAACEVPPRASN